MLEVVAGILAGAASGAVLALVGYAKSSTSETFDVKKAAQTVIVGVVVGGIGGYYGWGYDQAYQWASNMGIITVLEAVKKAVWRRLKVG